MYIALNSDHTVYVVSRYMCLICGAENGAS